MYEQDVKNLVVAKKRLVKEMTTERLLKSVRPAKMSIQNEKIELSKWEEELKEVRPDRRAATKVRFLKNLEIPRLEGEYVVLNEELNSRSDIEAARAQLEAERA